MSDDGSTKDDVKIPDGEVGDKINKLFTDEGKDTSKSIAVAPSQCSTNRF
jgi:translation initiation factor 5A